MGVNDVEKALALARTDETADFGSGASDQMIVDAERALGLTFPISYREFVSAVGWASFGGREFYGILPGGAINGIPSVVFATRAERNNGGLPQGFLLVEDSGAEGKFVIDTVHRGRDEESPVKVWTPGHGRADSTEIVAADFGSYILHAAEPDSL